MMKKCFKKKIKIGSLQKLVEHDGCVEDISYSLFSDFEV